MQFKAPLSRLILITALALSTSACANFGKQTAESRTRGWSEQRLYEEATRQIKRFNFDDAADYLERLDAQYPNSSYAQQTLLDLAYAYYKNKDTDLAIVTAERFIKSYPTHPNVDYAYYIRGVANYDRGFGFISKIFPPDPAQTDQANAIQTFKYLSELVQRFPSSRYTPDATKRLKFIRNNLSKYEAIVANYYLERDNYVAAVTRAKAVLQNFQSSPANKAALAVMVEAYTQMKMHDLAQDSMAILQQTYPKDPFTYRSYQVFTTKQPGSSMRRMIENMK